jgi:hypothetical protein
MSGPHFIITASSQETSNAECPQSENAAATAPPTQAASRNTHKLVHKCETEHCETMRRLYIASDCMTARLNNTIGLSLTLVPPDVLHYVACIH